MQKINKILGGIVMDVLINQEGKQKYINSLEIGQILAFKIGESVISGKVVDIGEYIRVETKNDTQFIISEEDIIWVKTGQRWPKGVFRALKGEKQNGTE